MTLKSYLEQKNKNKYVVSELCVLYNDFHKNFMWEADSNNLTTFLPKNSGK